MKEIDSEEEYDGNSDGGGERKMRQATPKKGWRERAGLVGVAGAVEAKPEDEDLEA